MHPRSTRHRPLLLIGPTEVFTNSIRSPTRCNNILIHSLLATHQQQSFFADVVSCSKVMGSTTSCHGILFEQFVIEFCNENSLEVCSTFQIVVYAPSRWSSQNFLDALDKVSLNQNVLSLIYGYYIKGKHFPFLTNNLYITTLL